MWILDKNAPCFASGSFFHCEMRINHDDIKGLGNTPQNQGKEKQILWRKETSGGIKR